MLLVGYNHRNSEKGVNPQNFGLLKKDLIVSQKETKQMKKWFNMKS